MDIDVNKTKMCKFNWDKSTRKTYTCLKIHSSKKNESMHGSQVNTFFRIVIRKDESGYIAIELLSNDFYMWHISPNGEETGKNQQK